MSVEPGDWLVTTAGSDRRVRLRAVRVEVIDGRPFVWAATAEEWERAAAEGRDPAASLWPMSSVDVVEEGVTSAVVVAAPVELDLTASEPFRDHVALCFTVGARDIVIDLRDTRFIDSAGIGALIGLTRRAQVLGIGLRLRHVGANVDTALRMSGASRVLQVEP